MVTSSNAFISNPTVSPIPWRPIPPTPSLPPPISAELHARNAAFWNDLAAELESLPAAIHRRVHDARAVGRWVLRSLTCWGVELQKLNQFEEAARFFTLATRLNPDNLVARINLDYNQYLQGSKAARLDLQKSIEEQSKYRTMDAFLAANGPVDDPRLLRQTRPHPQRPG